MSDWRLIEGDCLQIMASLPAGSCRLVFADPPYNIGVDYGDGENADRRPKSEYLAWCETWLASCGRLLTEDGSLWVLIDDVSVGYISVLLDRLGFHQRNWIKWYETFGVNCTRKFNRTSRHLLYFARHPRRFVFNAEAVTCPSARLATYRDRRANPAGKIWDDVWKIPRLVGNAKERIRGFPTQLPLALLRPIVGCATAAGDLILDPFAGSATTGVAALEAGRRFIGIEKQARFVELATRRLQQVSIPHE